jgi:hypothetical protein
VYDYDPEAQTELYQNFSRMGSRGLEVEYRAIEKWGFFTLNYAFYSAAGKEKVALYQVPGKQDVLLAFPAHQVNLSSQIKFAPHWSLSPSASLMSTRYGFQTSESLKRFAPTALVNLYIRRTHLLTKGLEAGLGVYDAMNQRFVFLQPYNGGHAPLPGPSREWLIRLNYLLPNNTH